MASYGRSGRQSGGDFTGGYSRGGLAAVSIDACNGADRLSRLAARAAREERAPSRSEDRAMAVKWEPGTALPDPVMSAGT